MAKKYTNQSPSQIKTTNQKLSYLEILASSLIVYAELDKAFGNEFKSMIKASRIRRVSGQTKKIKGLSLIMAPPDTLRAYQRAEWLLKVLVREEAAKNEPALSLLFDFVNDEPAIAPKSLVVGFAAVSIPGITLGRFSKRVMNIIISRNFLKNCGKLELSKKVAAAGIGVLSPALKKGGFNPKSVEPDIVEWIFGEREIDLYAASDIEMAKIKKDLVRAQVIHASSNKNSRPAVIALTPAANSEYVKNAWKMEFLGEHKSLFEK